MYANAQEVLEQKGMIKASVYVSSLINT